MESNAWRGGTLINDSELRSHLNLATRLNNVGVFLGAGASSCAGGKLLSDIWEGIPQDSLKWLKNNNFVDGKAAKNSSINIERLIDSLQIAEKEWTRKDPEGEEAHTIKLHLKNIYREILKASLLNDDIWNDPSLIEEDRSLYLHQQLLIRLLSTRQPGQPAPWIFTTNYDLAIEWAAESLNLRVINGFSGVHYRQFSSANFDLSFRNVQAKGEARFGSYHIYLGKLHGSISWVMNKKLYPREFSIETLNQAIRSFLNSSGESDWPGLMIFPSTSKYLETSGFVLGEITRRFSEFLSRPQTCLIINGYSFGDEHLNRILTSALHNPTLHLIIYSPEYNCNCNNNKCAKWLRHLSSLNSPQVTIIGNDERAYFKSFIDDIPQPALLDDYSVKVKKLKSLLEECYSEKSDDDCLNEVASAGEKP